MRQPLISIVITVLNGEKTIRECLASIADQTFSDYELIIIDGGSNDRTLEIVDASAVINKKVQVVPGIGLYAGLNVGIKLSAGKWLYFIGADDKLYDSNTLQNVSKQIEYKRQATKVLVGSVECLKQNILLRPMFGSPYLMRHQVHHQGMFYDRIIFANSQYNETMRIASDYEFNLQLALAGIPHEAMNIVICNFGGDGISENQMKHGFMEMQHVHKKLFEGISRPLSMKYFWIRRKVGALLRYYNLSNISLRLKRMFG